MIAPRIASALRRTARIAVDRPRATLWMLLALTAALFAVAVAGLTAVQVGTWTSVQRRSANLVVYLGDGVNETHARSLTAQLATLPGVEHAELVGAAESAARLQRSLGADSALLEGIELASLPASVEVTLAPGVRDVIAMSPIVRELRGMQGIDDVVIEDAGEERVVGTLRVVRLVAWTGAALLAGLAIIIVLASVRVRLDRAERERQLVYLLGGAPAFIIVPTALAGALQGALAAGLALLAVHLGLVIYGDGIARALHGALGSVELGLPAVSILVLFIALGAAIGFVGGGLAGASRAVR